MSNFLPINKSDALQRGWDEVDFVYVIGDAYVDHPSFGPAIISRVLEYNGFTVGIISQPDWHTADAFKEYGRPRLGFLVTSGNIDSMVAHYTAAKKKRSEDAYTPGGIAGKRPDRAVIVYSNRIREAYGNVPIMTLTNAYSGYKIIKAFEFESEGKKYLLFYAESETEGVLLRYDSTK